MAYSTVGLLPDGSPAPVWRATVRDLEGNEHTEDFTEWWWEGEQVGTVMMQVDDYFYSFLGKAQFQIISLEKVHEL